MEVERSDSFFCIPGYTIQYSCHEFIILIRSMIIPHEERNTIIVYKVALRDRTEDT